MSMAMRGILFALVLLSGSQTRGDDALKLAVPFTGGGDAKVVLRGGAKIIDGEGLGGKGALLLGADGYAEIDPKHVNVAEGTIAFWVRPLREPIDGSMTWMSWGWGRTGWPYMILSYGWWEGTGGRGRLAAILDNTTISGAGAPARPAKGQWVHYAATWRNAPTPVVRLYENGTLMATSGGGNVKPLPADRKIRTPIYLGSDHGSSLRGGRRGHAYMNHLTIHARCLSDAEIRQLFLTHAPDDVIRRAEDPLAWMDDAKDRKPRETRDDQGRLLEPRAIFDEGSHYLRGRPTIDAFVDRAHKAGFNVIIPCVYHGWGAHYRTDPKVMSSWARGYAAKNPTFNAFEYFLKRAHAKGVEVHSWFCVFLNEKRKGERPTWPQFSLDGKFYNGYDPGFRDRVVKLILDHARRYSVDGINLDYIRLGGGLGSESAAREYRRMFDRDLAKDRRDGKRMAEFTGRCVGDVVRRVREGLNKIRPGIVLSVDAVPNLKREGLASNGRNPARWLDAGWIDVAYTMCYSRRLAIDRMDAVRAESARPGGHVFIVGNYDRTAGKLVSRDPKLLCRLLDYCRRKYNDGGGVAMYIYSMLDDAQIAALRGGPFGERAAPHQANPRIPLNRGQR